MYKKIKLDPYLTSYTKVISKMNLKHISKTFLEILGENKRINLYDLEFFTINTKILHKSLRNKTVDKLDCIKAKNFCASNESINKMKNNQYME